MQKIIWKRGQLNAAMKKYEVVFYAVPLILMLNHVLTERVMAESYHHSLSATVLFAMPVVKELKQQNRLMTNDCLQKYLKAIPSRSFLVSADAPSGVDATVTYKRRNLEEQIVVILGDKVRDEARAFSQAVPIYVEWEGMSENPLSEANFADNWLSKRSDTPLAPVLYLFKAHRLRGGYECAKAGHEKGLWPILAVKYKESLQKAMSYDNPLIHCIAEDLEAQDHVYLEGYGRP